MSQAPRAEHKSSFVKSELETAKLKQSCDDGTRREHEAPVFDGEGAVERFFCVEEHFRHCAAKMDWTTGPEVFENFEEILTDVALEKWETRAQSAAPADQTLARFEPATQELLLERADPLAKDCVIKHLKDFRRPAHAKPRDRATRAETLVRCTNHLPGAEPNITPQQMKSMIFESFPVTWRQSWIRAGESSVTNTLPELAQFMANEQSFADERDESKKKEGGGNKKEHCRDRSHQRGRGRGGNKRRDQDRGGRGEATTKTTSAQGVDQVQTMIVLSMVDISGASATRVLVETTATLREEAAEMEDEVVAIPVVAMTVVEEVAKAVAATTTTMMETTVATSNATWMVRRNEATTTTPTVAKEPMAKEPINRALNNAIWT